MPDAIPNTSVTRATVANLAVAPLIAAMAEQITAQTAQSPPADESPAIIGIHRGGVWVAQRLHQLLGYQEPLGSLDISFYRDDFSRIGLSPRVRSSTLPRALDDRHILLIDDVLRTGRTIRAALNEIFAYGRPRTVKLGVLIERCSRELPIQADIIGRRITLPDHQEIKLRQQDQNLTLQVINIALR